MQFRETSSIYLQIADHVCEKILLQQWKPGDRIPSVRELAAQLEVNPNTVMRSYEFLQQQQIIYNQRGIGYFVSEDAVQQVLHYRKAAFMQNDLPQVFRSLYLLGLELDGPGPYYEQYKQQHFSQAAPANNQAINEKKQ